MEEEKFKAQKEKAERRVHALFAECVERHCVAFGKESPTELTNTATAVVGETSQHKMK